MKVSNVGSSSVLQRWGAPIIKRLVVYGGLLAILLAWTKYNCWCPGPSRTTPPEGDLAAMAARLESDVHHLSVVIGERNVRNRPEKLDVAADWIRDQWKDQGLDPKEYSYEALGKECRNIEVDFAGPDTGPLIVVGAHYDSPEASPGADDNGTGIAVLLEIVRALNREPLGVRLRAVAFVNEEPPFFYTETMGSMVYAKMAKDRKDPIRLMIALETLGFYTEEPKSQDYPWGLGALYPDKGNFVGVVGCLSGRPDVVKITPLLRSATDVPIECASLWYKLPGVSLSDHASFWRNGFNAVMITDTAMFRNAHYHQLSDQVQTLNFPIFARVTAGIVATLRGLSRVD